MKTTVNSIPGYRMFEYMLVLTVPEDLASRISKVKEHFSETYKHDQSKWIRPQVPLASFEQYAMMEERLLNRLRTVAMAYPPFKVELKDFGSFPSHTIFINVTSRLPVQQLVKNVRSQAQRLMKANEEHKPYFMLEPHITIARKLLPWQYEKGWLEFSQLHFTGKFIADSMSLLKRPAGEMKFSLVEKFQFQHLPVVTRQGELFG
jgi:2'-5' RNA ligase